MTQERFARNKAVEIAPMKDETVLFNPGNNKFCVLNVTAAFIWHALEHLGTAEEITVALSQRFTNVDVTLAARDVRMVIEALRNIECVFAN
jgi:hypothetical protein